MVQFAREILQQTMSVVKQLEKVSLRGRHFGRYPRRKPELTQHYTSVQTLGPDTSDLRLKIGLNSGAVTAGVLRGDR